MPSAAQCTRDFHSMYFVAHGQCQGVYRSSHRFVSVPYAASLPKSGEQREDLGEEQARMAESMAGGQPGAEKLVSRASKQSGHQLEFRHGTGRGLLFAAHVLQQSAVNCLDGELDRYCAGDEPSTDCRPRARSMGWSKGTALAPKKQPRGNQGRSDRMTAAAFGTPARGSG